MESLHKINKLIDMAEKRKRRPRSKSPKSKVDDLIRMTEQRREHLEHGRKRALTDISKIDNLIRLAEQRKREFRNNYDYSKRTFPEIHRANVPVYAPARKSSSPKTHRRKHKIKIHNDPYDIHRSNVSRKYLEHLKHKTRRSR
jgi:septal ring factor EnvC (AmiA/AmiB activator)